MVERESRRIHWSGDSCARALGATPCSRAEHRQNASAEARTGGRGEFRTKSLVSNTYATQLEKCQSWRTAVKRCFFWNWKNYAAFHGADIRTHDFECQSDIRTHDLVALPRASPPPGDRPNGKKRRDGATGGLHVSSFGNPANMRVIARAAASAGRYRSNRNSAASGRSAMRSPFELLT
jgi:hypothetical protein